MPGLRPRSWLRVTVTLILVSDSNSVGLGCRSSLHTEKRPFACRALTSRSSVVFAPSDLSTLVKPIDVDERESEGALNARWNVNVLRLVRLTAIAFILASLFQNYCITSYRVSGNSMQPSFTDGDRVVVASLLPYLVSPRDGDTVIVRVDND